MKLESSPSLQRFRQAVEEFDDDAGSFQVTNAFVFGNQLYACLEIINYDAIHAGVLVEVTLGSQISHRPILELDDFPLNYWAHDPRRHWVIEHEGGVLVIDNDNVTRLPRASEHEISGIAAVDPTSVVILGEEGGIFHIHDGLATQLATGTNERILEAHFVRPDLAYAVGEYGTFLQGGLQGFTPVNLPASAFDSGERRSKFTVCSVYAKPNGAVMLGTREGPAYLYEKGELQQLEGLPDEGEATVSCVAEFKGVEYWGSDGFGLLTREARTLVPKFAMGGAGGLHVTDRTLTCQAGSFVYIFDGSEWIELQFNLDVDNLVERIPLDFEP